MELTDSARIYGQKVPVVDNVWELINEVDIQSLYVCAYKYLPHTYTHI